MAHEERDAQTQRLLAVGLVIVVVVFLLIWKGITHGTRHDPVFIAQSLFGSQEDRSAAIPPPRNLLSWRDSLQGEELNRFQAANKVLSKDPRRAGRLLWPVARAHARMRPSVSFAFVRLAHDALRSQKYERSLVLATMATAFNSEDFLAHEMAWNAATALEEDEKANHHYQRYLETRPNLEAEEGAATSPGVLLLGLLVVGGVVVVTQGKKLRLGEKLDAWLISDLVPPGDSSPASRSPAELAGTEAPPPPPPVEGGTSEEIHRLGEERKKSITGILSAEAFLQDVQKAFDNKDYEKGVDLCVKAVEMNPANTKKVSSICLAEGIRLFEVGDYQNSKELLEVALHFEPHILEAHTCLGNCFIKLGDFAKAKEQYEKVIEVDSKNGDAYYTLGVCYQKVKDLPRAKRSFQVAVEIKDHPNSHFYLAKLFEAEKDYASAMSHWQKFIDLAPKSPQADAARARLDKLASLAGGSAGGAG